MLGFSLNFRELSLALNEWYEFCFSLVQKQFI